jgi:large subunit ribosomal protein L29
MAKVRELRDMGEEQIRLVWKDAAESLFRLRIQAQTEKLASTSAVREHRRTIARCQTILTQRGLLKHGAAAAASHHAASGQGESSPQHEKHAKKRGETGRAKVHATGKGGVAKKREFKKRTQSGT